MESDIISKNGILVVGCGSIGRRHAKNLKDLGMHVGLYDVDTSSCAKICAEMDYEYIGDLDKGLSSGQFSAGVVCTPNDLHILIAQKIVDAGLHIFIEKPLSNSIEGVPDLIDSVKKKGLIAMAGFNLRYETGLQYVKSVLTPDNVAFARIECGSHMPLWRIGVDYRKTYSANRSMGGGIILDDVHELDYTCWLLGYPEKITCEFGKYSDFEIDVEDTAEFIFLYSNKLVTIHSDYLQRNYSRNLKVCFRNGYSLEWVYGKYVKEFFESGEKVYDYSDSFDPNAMYFEEMKDFLKCIKLGITPNSNLENALKILEIALVAKQ